MPPRKASPRPDGGPAPTAPRAGLTLAVVTAPCPGCGSVACAATGLDFCRHTGAPRTPDPVAAARRAASRLPGPLIPLEAS